MENAALELGAPRWPLELDKRSQGRVGASAAAGESSERGFGSAERMCRFATSTGNLAP